MSDFRRLDGRVFASPQVTLDNLAEANELEVAVVINNRPEGESDDQTPGSVIEAGARDLGMDYIAIPISHSGFSATQVEAMAEALASTDRPVLAYCRSGTRSTLLWALSEAKCGRDPETITSMANAAGYDVSPVRPAMDMYAALSRG